MTVKNCRAVLLFTIIKGRSGKVEGRTEEKRLSDRKEFAVKEKLAKIREEILKQIDASENLDKLNEVRVSALGKKGALTELLKSMKEVAPQRPSEGWTDGQ